MMGLLMTGARHTGASATAPLTMMAPEQPTFTAQTSQARARHVAVDDLDILLAAVAARLRRIVASAAAATAPGHDGGDSMVAGVQECSDALDQLGASLRMEITRTRQLEQDVFDAYAELARMRAGLPAATPPARGSGRG